MKLSSVLAFLLLLLPHALPAQWTNLGTQSIPFQMTSDYHGIRVTQHGAVAPNTGPIWKVWRTEDDWVTKQLGYTGGGGITGCCPTETIFFLNDSVGFVQYLELGLKHLAVTHDRGVTFADFQPNLSFALMPSNDAALTATDDTTAYVIGENFALNATHALRLTPTRVDTIFVDTTMIGEGSRILFLSDQVGFVIGTDHLGICRLYRTTNGGQSWTQRLAVNVGQMRAIDFIDDSTGYVAGASGVCYRTTDAGLTWNSIAINGPVDVYAMDFANALVGYIGATQGLVLRTVDGGLNWSSDVIDSAATVRYVKAVNTTMAYAQTQDSVLYKRDYIAGEGEAADPIAAIAAYPNPAADWVHIALPNALVLRSWSLVDLQGHMVAEGRNLEIDLRALPFGLYFLEVATNKGLRRLKVMHR